MKYLFIGGPAHGHWREANHATEPVLELQFSEVRDASEPPPPIPEPKVHVYSARDIAVGNDVRAYFCLRDYEPAEAEVRRLLERGPQPEEPPAAKARP